MSPPDPIDYHPTIKDLPSGDRPCERLIREGATVLSMAELLAIIFRVGVGGENVIALSQCHFPTKRVTGLYNKMIDLLDSRPSSSGQCNLPFNAPFKLATSILGTSVGAGISKCVMPGPTCITSQRFTVSHRSQTQQLTGFRSI